MLKKIKLFFLSSYLLFLMTSVCFTLFADDETGAGLQSNFIWLRSAPAGQQVYAVFRKQFELANTPQKAELNLFADSRYILWINGNYIERGPCRFDPIAPEYDVLDIKNYLRPGENTIAVLTHHYDNGKENSGLSPINGRIMRHSPGLTARMDITHADGNLLTIYTDETWRGSTETRFLPSPPDSWSSIPDRIDARRDTGDWTKAGFDDSTWEQAVKISGKSWGALRARSIPRLQETVIEPLRCPEKINKPLAEILPLSLTSGEQLVIDAGHFVQAYTVLEFDGEEGSQIETENAQSYYQTGNKPSGSYRCVNQYTARAGLQTYMSGDTSGFKYMIIRVTKGCVRLMGVNVISRIYPFQVLGRFHSNDEILNRLWEYSVNTVKVCSEDAYVDCAVRERVEWMADGYIPAYQVTRMALAGPGEGGQPRYSDPRLLRNLLRHIGQSAQPDGRVKAHHPSDRWDIHGYIEDYACLWIQAIREYVDNSGDIDLARELWPAVKSQLQWFFEHRTERGLVKARDFVYPGSNPLCYKVCEGATLNAYLVRALLDAACLAEQMGLTAEEQTYRTSAQQLQESINNYLWNEKTGSYFGGIVEGQPYPSTVPAAFISLYFNIVPPAWRSSVQEWLLQHYQEQGGLPYSYHFLLKALYDINTKKADQLVLDIIRNKWAAMANSETQTCWEGFEPGENCHEAGSVPAYFLSAYILGVRLDGPVSKRLLRIEPRLGDLKQAEGIVVTEAGLVRVQWQKQADEKSLKFEIEIPKNVEATLALPFDGENPQLIIDDHLISRSQVQTAGRMVEAKLGPGLHHGNL